MPVTDRLIFGGAALSSVKSYKYAFRLLDTALDLGISRFDTARAYGQGYSEKIFGQFARANPQIRITTKVGLGPTDTAHLSSRLALPLNYYRRKWRPTQPTSHREEPGNIKVKPPSRLSIDYVRASVDESFRLLGSANIDGLLLHENVPSRLDDASLDYLCSLVREGKVGKLGVGGNRSMIAEFYRTVPGFEVLQYDGHGDEDGLLMSRFPDYEHRTFGWLKNLGTDSASSLLQHALNINQKGMVLFSTRCTDRLRSTVQSLIDRD